MTDRAPVLRDSPRIDVAGAGGLEPALRLLRRKTAGPLAELKRRHEFAQTPTQRRRRKRAVAIARQRRAAQRRSAARSIE